MPRHSSRKDYQAPFIRPYTVPNAPYTFDNDDQDMDALGPLMSSQKKTFVCRTCRRPFTSSGHLSRHERIHTGEKRHKCPFPGCETSCSRPDNLQQHYRIHLSPGSRQSSYGRTRAAISKQRDDSPLGSPEQDRPGHPISRPTRKPRPPSSKHPPRQIKSKPMEGADPAVDVRIRLPSPVLPPRRRPPKKNSEFQFRKAVIPPSRSSTPDSLERDTSPGGRASPIDLTVGPPFDVPTPPDTPPPLEEAPLSARLARSNTWTGVLPYSPGAPMVSGSGSSLNAHITSSSSLAHAHGQPLRHDSRDTSSSSSPVIPRPSRVQAENGEGLLFPPLEPNATGSSFLRDRGISAQSGIHAYEQQVHHAIIAQLGLSLSRSPIGGSAYMSYGIPDSSNEFLEGVESGFDGGQEHQGSVEEPPSSVPSSSPDTAAYASADQAYDVSPPQADDLYQHQRSAVETYSYGYEELHEDPDSSPAYPSVPPNTAHHPLDETQSSAHLGQGAHDHMGGLVYSGYDEAHSGLHRDYHEYDASSSQPAEYDAGPPHPHQGVMSDAYASTDTSDDITRHGTSYAHAHATFGHMYGGDGNYEPQRAQASTADYSRPSSADGYAGYDQTTHRPTLPEHSHSQDATDYHEYQYANEQGTQHHLVNGHASAVQMIPDVSHEASDSHSQALPPADTYSIQQYFVPGPSQFYDGAQLDVNSDAHRSHPISPRGHTVRMPVDHQGPLASTSQTHVEMNAVNQPMPSGYPGMHPPSHHVAPDAPHTPYGQYGQYGYHHMSSDYDEYREPAPVIQSNAPSDSPVHYTMAQSQAHYPPHPHAHAHSGPSEVHGSYAGMQYDAPQHAAPMYSMQAVERPRTPLPPVQYSSPEVPSSVRAPDPQMVHTRMLEPMTAMPFPAYPTPVSAEPPYRPVQAQGMYDDPHLALAPSLSRRDSPLHAQHQYEALMPYGGEYPAPEFHQPAFHDQTYVRRHPPDMFVRDAWGHAADWQHANNGAATAAG